MGFWALLFGLLYNDDPASKYHRVEVLYDVLLPWLTGKCLSLAWGKDTPEMFY